MTRDEARSKIIFALDVDTFNAAKHWVATLSGRVGMFKVGKQLFTAYGPDIVRMVENFGAEVFLDLKYHDIPNTVAMASREAARLKVKLFNLHALGGYEMMARTMEMMDREFPGNNRPSVLAVTILTSSTEETLRDVGIDHPVAEMVPRLALLAKRAGTRWCRCLPPGGVADQASVRQRFPHRNTRCAARLRRPLTTRSAS